MDPPMQELPPPPPPPPQTPRVTIIGGGQGPAAFYRAQVAQREVLGDQLEELTDSRTNIAQRLRDDPEITGADRAGLESRIAALDARIAEVDKQIATTDAAVARAAGVPGAVVEDPPVPRDGPPEAVFVLGGMFIVIVLLPISLAYARRIWRRSATAVTSLPQEVMERLTRLDHAVDSIAVEVERIGEGQRFMTRVLSEKSAPPALGGGQERK
jgi:hypothetical protein